MITVRDENKTKKSPAGDSARSSPEFQREEGIADSWKWLGRTFNKFVKSGIRANPQRITIIT